MSQDLSYCSSLNAQQREAVLHIEGPILILAGAGTGKTRVLTTRIAHLLASNKALPGQILAVTFTNKASKEMLARISNIIPGGIHWCGTFHSISARILRQNAAFIGFKSSFTILDTEDQLRLLNQILKDYGIDEKRHPAKLLAHIISRYKDKGWKPEQVPATEENDFANGSLLTLYSEYQKRLKFLQAMDFGDLILSVVDLLNNNLELLEHYQRKFKYILVDEYQDTNAAQYLWLRLFAQKLQNICCVGDDDQSIYGWRGAEVRNILRFDQDFANAKVVRLERNYRSTSFILEAASSLISHNRDRHGKTLWTENATGEKVKLNIFYDDKQEAREIADEIDIMHRLRKKPLNEIAILIRAGYQTRGFEESLNYMKIPYRIIGGAKFYDRTEIKDALGYMRLISNPEDSLAFERIVNIPRRGIGETTVAEIREHARENGLSMLAAAENMLTLSLLKSKAAAGIGAFIANIATWQQMLEKLPHVEVIDKMLDESGYREMLKSQEPQESKDRLDNLKELMRSLSDFPSLADYLEHVGLVNDNDSASDDQKLSILTMHAAKGLEFDTVFLPGWEEGIFPSARATAESNSTNSLEEERRLAYVAITRAKEHLYISYACNRRIYGTYNPSESSRFIDELPQSSYEIQNNFSVFNRSSVPQPKLHAPVTQKPNSLCGQRVSHKKFGVGRIVAMVEGNIAQIVFDNHGFKNITMEYLEML